MPDYCRFARLMILSKDGNPVTWETRPIALEPLLRKAIGAVWMYITEDRMWETIPNNQVGFKKGGTTSF